MIKKEQQHYQAPYFSNQHRLENILKLSPKIEAAYQEYTRQKHCPGYAFGVVVDGNLILAGEGGYSNLKEKIPVTSKTCFRIASMTKSFTAMAILRLRDEGKLRLDDVVQQYVPEIKELKLTLDSPEITIRDLLIHSAGLPQDDPWGDRNLDYNDQDVITLLQQGISLSQPARVGFEYSNLAYTLLGLIITKLSDMPFQQFITSQICKPIGMEDAAWEYAAISPQQLARGYSWLDRDWEEEALLPDGSFGAMGGLIASVEAFSRYVALHQAAWPARNEPEAPPIKRSSLREMHQLHQFHECGEVYVLGYGYGLRVMVDKQNRRYVGHGGGLPGFGCHWLMMPDYGIGLILLTNATYAVLGDEIHIPLLEMMVDDASLQPREIPPIPLLQAMRNVLLQLLPTWHNAQINSHFASNFFLDNRLDDLVKKSMKLFNQIGKVIEVSDVIPENQLRGGFYIKGERGQLKVHFTLTPQHEPLIQAFSIELA